MIVERLVPDPRRPGAIRVVTGGQPAWTVRAAVVDELGLVEGGGIPPGALPRLEAAADEEAAFRAALRHLERRSHAVRELGRKLARKGHPEAAVEAALARLASLGLLDDAAHARQVAASRAAAGLSGARIRRDLIALGIERGEAEQAVRSAIADDTVPDPLERVLAQARRRAATMAGLPAPARQRRLLAFFGRRGWGGEEARAHVRAILREVGASR